MMITENATFFCNECKRSMKCCFCSCPYCGEITKSCLCDLEGSTKNTILQTKQKSKLTLLKHTTKSSLSNTEDDDWWRLEKWQIGRRNFA